MTLASPQNQSDFKNIDFENIFDPYRSVRFPTAQETKSPQTIEIIEKIKTYFVQQILAHSHLKPSGENILFKEMINKGMALNVSTNEIETKMKEEAGKGELSAQEKNKTAARFEKKLERAKPLSTMIDLIFSDNNDHFLSLPYYIDLEKAAKGKDILIHFRIEIQKALKTLFDDNRKIVFFKDDFEKNDSYKKLDLDKSYSEWVNEITNYTTLTSAILYVMGRKKEGTLLSIEEIKNKLCRAKRKNPYQFLIRGSSFDKKRILKALNRLIRITRNEKFRVFLCGAKFGIFKNLPEEYEYRPDDSEEIEEEPPEDINEYKTIPALAEDAEKTSRKLKESHQNKYDYMPTEKELLKELGSAEVYYHQKLFNHELLPQEEINKLRRQAGPKPKDEEEPIIIDMEPINEIVKYNMRLVCKWAYKYSKYTNHLMFWDLVERGREGLEKAAIRFEPERGCKFSTYATWWIKQVIERAIADNERTVRISVHRLDFINKIKKAKRTFLKENSREPDEFELAGKLGIDVEKLREIRANYMGKTISLETSGPEEDGNGKIFGAEDWLGKEEEGYNNIEHEDWMNKKIAKIRKLIYGNTNENDGKRMHEKDRRFYIFEKYCTDKHDNKNFNESATLEEIGVECGMTRERVRQLLEKIRRRIKDHKKSLFEEEKTEKEPEDNIVTTKAECKKKYQHFKKDIEKLINIVCGTFKIDRNELLKEEKTSKESLRLGRRVYMYLLKKIFDIPHEDITLLANKKSVCTSENAYEYIDKLRRREDPEIKNIIDEIIHKLSSKTVIITTEEPKSGTAEKPEAQQTG